jgi:hypothetical protein
MALQSSHGDYRDPFFRGSCARGRLKLKTEN